MATKPAVTSAVPPWTTYGSGARAIATPTSAGSLATMSGGEPIGAVTVGRRKATVRLGANHAARLILTHISAAAVVTLVILSLSGNTVGDARNLLTGRNLIALTGDLGSLDDAGRLRIVGRKKDMFIVGGFNAYPAEIEGFLLEHPAVPQAAVIGVPDERLGQVCSAFVVPKAPVTAEELIAWSRERMAGFKVPRFVKFLDELPLNATGKVMKDQLRYERHHTGARRHRVNTAAPRFC